MIIELQGDLHSAETGLSKLTARAPELCDRHRGVGADGLLVIQPLRVVTLDEPRYEMLVINSDGSFAEMCGNGLRCVAHYLHKRGLLDEGGLLRTGAGDLQLSFGSPPESLSARERQELERSGGWVGARLGRPRDVTLRQLTAEGAREPLSFALMSLGNPHAVTFEPAAFSERRTLAKQLERRFPEGVNLSFARQLSPRQIELFVHERGCGWTQACGTGACATAVAAVSMGLAERGTPLQISLPGGDLFVTWTARGALDMWGAAVEVYDGVITL